MADFVRQLSRAPEHIKHALRMNDISEVEADAYLFQQLFDDDLESWTTEAMSLLPESLQHDSGTLQAAEDCLRRIRKACHTTTCMAQYTALQLHTCSESKADMDHMAEDKHKAAIEEATQKWRHWKPRLQTTVSPLTQRQIELILAD